jgi:hypothetical protein
MSNTTLIKVVPVFVAIMVWLIRVLIIGTFSVAGNRLFTQTDSHNSQRSLRPVLQPASSLTAHVRPPVANAFRPASKVARPESAYARQEPTYHNLALSAKPAREAEYVDSPRNS